MIASPAPSSAMFSPRAIRPLFAATVARAPLTMSLSFFCASSGSEICPALAKNRVNARVASSRLVSPVSRAMRAGSGACVRLTRSTRDLTPCRRRDVAALVAKDDARLRKSGEPSGEVERERPGGVIHVDRLRAHRRDDPRKQRAALHRRPRLDIDRVPT
jgi:hypothetical protein